MKRGDCSLPRFCYMANNKRVSIVCYIDDVLKIGGKENGVV